MDEEVETTSLWNTRFEDMTVGDYAKLNAYVLAFTAGAGVVAYEASVVYNRVSNWRYNRKMAKLAATDTES